QARWQVVSFVKSDLLAEGAAAQGAGNSSTSKLKTAAPQAPFTDFRYESPGTTRKITAKDLPEPFVTKSSDNGPDVVARPTNAWPIAPAGFKVGLYAAGLDNPRTLKTAPNGDIFLAETESGKIRVFRGLDSDGKPETTGVFASGLKRPYGIAFYPP